MRSGSDDLAMPEFVLDLSAVSAPTAACLGSLVALHNRLKALGVRLVLAEVGPMAHEVLKVTRLTELFIVRLAAHAEAKRAA